jgi:hypothetical protein
MTNDEIWEILSSIDFEDCKSSYKSHYFDLFRTMTHWENREIVTRMSQDECHEWLARSMYQYSLFLGEINPQLYRKILFVFREYITTKSFTITLEEFFKLRGFPDDSGSHLLIYDEYDDNNHYDVVINVMSRTANFIPENFKNAKCIIAVIHND